MDRRVIVTGATGLIGAALCRRLQERGYAPVVFSRDPARARTQLPGLGDYVAWEPAEDGAWASALDGAYGVVSLAGASVFGPRWTPAYKREIRDTRTVGTRGLVRAMAKARSQPQVFVSASAIGVYGFRDDTPLDETAAPGRTSWPRSASPGKRRRGRRKPSACGRACNASASSWRGTAGRCTIWPCQPGWG